MPDEKNTGFIVSYPRPTDFMFGAETGIPPRDVMLTSDWRPYKPTGTKQAVNGFETSYCVTFSLLNILKASCKRMWQAGEISAEKKTQLQNWGYADADGNFSFSFAFTGKMSGTTWKGNTLQAVLDSVRKDGLVPLAMWSKFDAKNWDEWAAEIPVQVKNFAKNILTMFDFNYEWLVVGNCGQANLAIIKNALKQCPLQLASPYCGADANGAVQVCGDCIAQHATAIFAVDDFMRVFDSYEPFDKKYALNFQFPFIMKVVATVKFPVIVPAPVPFGHIFNVKISLGDVSEEALWLQKALIKLGFKTYPTGKYLGITQAAVKAFQIKYALASAEDIEYIDGRWVGVITRAKLNELLKTL